MALKSRRKKQEDNVMCVMGEFLVGCILEIIQSYVNLLLIPSRMIVDLGSHSQSNFTICLAHFVWKCHFIETQS
jgi:hypothetical protein